MLLVCVGEVCVVVFVLELLHIGLVDCSCVTNGETLASLPLPLLLSPLIPIDSLHPIHY
jgi:hypothetical protein